MEQAKEGKGGALFSPECHGEGTFSYHDLMTCPTPSLWIFFPPTAKFWGWKERNQNQEGLFVGHVKSAGCDVQSAPGAY